MTKPGQARSQTPAPQAQATKPRRIGLYGGAFDPPHLAHVALAQAAVQQLGLERIYIIPTGQPWMKQRQLTPPAHRLHMAQAAFASIPQAVVDDCELRRSGTTYTIDTLRELQRRYATAAATDAPASATTHAITPAAPTPANHPPSSAISWYLIMGEDLVQTLPQWQRAEDLLREVTIAVQPRPQPAAATRTNPKSHTQNATNKQLAKKNAGMQIQRLHLPPSTISSSTIRQELQQRIKQTTQDRLVWLQTLVPPAVARYIEHHQLYISHDEL